MSQLPHLLWEPPLPRSRSAGAHYGRAAFDVDIGDRMPILLVRLWKLTYRRLRGWPLPVAVTATIFATSWAAMALLDPDNDLRRPENFWWWYLVTTSTVGYGDLYPETTGGRIVATYVIVGGIATLTILFSQLSEYLQRVKGRRMRGTARLDHDGHLVVIGYRAGRTERIVAELVHERGRQLVLCTGPEIGEHPMAEHPLVSFVRGELTSQDVMSRAAVASAKTVVVDVHDDNAALAVALAVDHANAHVHVVVGLRDLERREQIRYVNAGFQCVPWHQPYMLTEEALDPGITEVYADLMSSTGHGNTYSAPLPSALDGKDFGECQIWFGRSFGATVIAVRGADGVRVSPPWDTVLSAGTTVYYLGSERIDRRALDARR